MENYSVTFLETALDDLEEIILFIATDKREAALKWHDKLIKKAESLATSPRLGSVVPDKKLAEMGYRMIPIGNHILFYKIYEDEKEITILRILNAKQDYPQFFKSYYLQNTP